MIYLIRVFNALLRPRAASRRIECAHPSIRSELIDLGRSKRWSCPDCGASWFAFGDRSAS